MCPLFDKQWCVPRQSWAIHHKNNCLTCEFLKLYVGNGHFYVGIATLQLPDEEQILFTEREICLGAPTRHKLMPTSIHEYLACKISCTWDPWTHCLICNMDLLMQFTTTKPNMYPTPPWINAAHVTTCFDSRNFLCWDAQLLPTPQLQELIGQQNKEPKLLYDPRINLRINIFAKVLSQPPTQGHMDEARELIFSHQLLEVMTGLIGHAHNLLNTAYIHQQGLHVQQPVDAFDQLTMLTRCRNTCSVIPHADFMTSWLQIS